RELLVIRAAQSACLDAQQRVVRANCGKRKLALVELPGCVEHKCTCRRRGRHREDRCTTDTVRAVVAPPDLSLTDWAVLGIVAEAPTHGFAIARALSATGDVGQVWTVARPLVYRSLTTLADRGLIEERGETQSGHGPTRTMVRATRAGRAALVRWLDKAGEHAREGRNAALMNITV